MKQFLRTYVYGILFIIVFFGVITYLFGEEFTEFQKTQAEKQEYQKTLTESKNIFQHKDIVELGDDVILHSTPDLVFLEKLVNYIDSAEERVWLEVYIFTEKRILEALIRASNRGVDVKVLLENNPYMAPYLNNKHYTALKDTGVSVKWSDPLNYALNHSKFMIVDERVFVSTGNYSYSSFNSNRDIFLEVFHQEIVGELGRLFLHDYRHEPFGVLHPNIVLSPDNSRQKIESLFLGANEKIDMYFPYMSDEALLDLVIDTAERGVEIHFILGEDARENSHNEIIRLINAGVNIYFMRRPKLHAKTILMDDKILYIGSINFSFHSMNSNREVGLLLKDTGIITEFQKLFKKDISLLK
ncbi:phospholipase D-like domain-containing protein [Candidatus Gracilibacteria bacterium]|nr:phospholipase D-like domain-containing protein [Candidatus Gracilibacteria bacterium]